MDELPKIPESIRGRLNWDITPSALAKWNPGLCAAASEEGGTITILDVIGEDFWTGEGVTAKRIAAALRNIGAENPVTVYMNSPGGDLFEGLAIYSLLREHKGEVTIKILGVAASAASVIAMAGDKIEISRAGFYMIHDAWVIAIGNRNDLREVADWLEPFDRSMADIYAARSGKDAEEILKMMDRETWIGGSQAVADGFADDLLESDQIKEDANARGERLAAHTIDRLMAKAGVPRSERRRLLADYKSSMLRAAGTGTPGAAEESTRNAALLKETAAQVAKLSNLFEGMRK